VESKASQNSAAASLCCVTPTDPKPCGEPISFEQSGALTGWSARPVACRSFSGLTSLPPSLTQLTTVPSTLFSAEASFPLSFPSECRRSCLSPRGALPSQAPLYHSVKARRPRFTDEALPISFFLFSATSSFPRSDSIFILSLPLFLVFLLLRGTPPFLKPCHCRSGFCFSCLSTLALRLLASLGRVSVLWT